MPKYLLPGLIVMIVLLLTLSGCRSAPAGPEEIPDAGAVPLSVGDTAPDFTLPAAAGGEVSLSRLVKQQDVLLYFNMAYG
jgi:hypothetical protein